ncbi:MAG TPA: CDP-diacylglycerol--serine O-phosphatidyltransferase [Longimicrobiaceae bacterium]|nr:CDP-diacylglycerol--serine O-phosphatidyltransferase [Longimicrobiaceae bacterium]
MKRPTARRRLQRGIIVLPSAFTLGNLFLGFWAMVSASRGNFELAAWLIVIAAVVDMLDGRIARFTSTGSGFGEQLDSLVDAISFGVAPAIIFYFHFLVDGVWSWTLAYIYVAAVIVRLARFNVEQSGLAKANFHGLPSPTAGMTVATFYPFSQTELFQDHLAFLPWNSLAAGLLLALSALMMSHVLYPVVPRFDPRTVRGRVTMGLAIAATMLAFTIPSLFFFPAAITYITFGLVRSVLAGFDARLPARDPLIDVEETEEGRRELEYESILPLRPFRRFRRPKS